jgi:homoserine acetyltransferase
MMMIRRGFGVLRAAPASLLLGRELDQLDMTDELLALRLHQTRVEVIGSLDDKMTPAILCRELAELADGDYREVSAPGGHLWPLVSPQELRAVLTDAESG